MEVMEQRQRGARERGGNQKKRKKPMDRQIYLQVGTEQWRREGRCRYLGKGRAARVANETLALGDSNSSRLPLTQSARAPCSLLSLLYALVALLRLRGEGKECRRPAVDKR